MKSSRLAREVFEVVMGLPEAERAAAVELACEGDSDLAKQVREMIRSSEGRGGSLNTPTADVGALRAPSEQPGDQIGPYKLLQQIGEGGFGVVFMADQVEPIRRRVALKVIKLGMDTNQVIARFEAERQALALMDHANIARVLDAGATDSGRPYFAMELVTGVPITAYCDRARLSLAERVALMVPVCEAVQHAHHKGIIHRDLKPSNVLVTVQDGKPVPKIIDFGIAKAISQRLTERTLFTEFGQFVGTPEYMSPEQADNPGVDVDARSDVYALGVLLYELLAGGTPFDSKTLRSKGFDEMRRIIREDEPPRLSVRAATLASTSEEIATRRRVDPTALGDSLRNEHEWIVLRCIEKERSRRYTTPSALAEDLQRLLRNEAVSAAPPSAAYRVKKFVRRHRREAAFVSLGVGLLLLGFVGTSLGLAWALRERAAAEAARAEAVSAAESAQRQTKHAQRVNEFLQSALLRPQSYLDDGATLADRLLQDAESIFGAGHPTIGALMTGVGAVLAADVSRREDALAVLSRTTGAANQDLMLINRSAVAFMWGEYDEAVALLREAVTIREARYGVDAIETASTRESLALAMLMRVLFLRGQDAVSEFSEAAEVYRDVIQVYTAVLPPRHPRLLDATAGYGFTLCSSGQQEAGVSELESVIDDMILSSQVKPFIRSLAANTLAIHYYTTKQQDRMIEMYLTLGRLIIDEYGSDPSIVASTLERLSNQLRQQGANEAADELFALAAPLDTIADRFRRAVERAGYGDYGRAAEEIRVLLSQVIDDRPSPSLLFDASSDLLTNTLIGVLARGGRHEEALELADKRAADLRSSLGDAHPRLRALELSRLIAVDRAGRSDEAEAAAEALIVEALAVRPPDTLAVRHAFDLLRSLARQRGDEAREIDFAQRAARSFRELNQLIGKDGFEGQSLGAFPAAWFPPGVDSSSQLAFVTDEQPFEGDRCLRLDGLPGVDSTLASGAGFRNLMKRTGAVEHRGKSFRLTAAIRIEGGTPGAAQAQMWARVDRPNFAKPFFFDNMADRPIMSSEWAVYEISGRIDDDAEEFYMGVMAFGEAVVWIDNVEFQILE